MNRLLLNLTLNSSAKYNVNFFKSLNRSLFSLNIKPINQLKFLSTQTNNQQNTMNSNQTNNENDKPQWERSDRYVG